MRIDIVRNSAVRSKTFSFFATKALFSASLLLLVEKLFLRFVAIRFHQKALADRLAENKLALKALDRLSNAQPAAPRKSPYITGGKKRGHRSNGGSRSASMDVLNKELGIDSSMEQADANNQPRSLAMGRKRRRKAVAAMIVDQLGDAIGQVALKDSKFNRGGEITGLHSARRLARQLFSTLSNVIPPRNHLIVEGRLTNCFVMSKTLTACTTDFYPYFRSEAEAVSLLDL